MPVGDWGCETEKGEMIMKGIFGTITGQIGFNTPGALWKIGLNLLLLFLLKSKAVGEFILLFSSVAEVCYWE